MDPLLDNFDKMQVLHKHKFSPQHRFPTKYAIIFYKLDYNVYKKIFQLEIYFANSTTWICSSKWIPNFDFYQLDVYIFFLNSIYVIKIREYLIRKKKKNEKDWFNSDQFTLPCSTSLSETVLRKEAWCAWRKAGLVIMLPPSVDKASLLPVPPPRPL